MKTIGRDLPIEIRKWVREDDFVTLCWENAARTYFIQSQHGENKYIKIQRVGAAEPLDSQVKRLIWLQGRLPVPRVLDYGITGSYEYLVTAEIPGIVASNEIFQGQAEEVLEIIADGLRSIHDIPIENCPFDHSMEQLMSAIHSNYNQGRIDPSDLHRKFSEDSLEKLLQEIEDYAKSWKEDLVFCHGDYSLTNILLDEGRISGFLDLGSCGIADRYFDLAVAAKSIVMNFGKAYVEPFFAHYGIDDIDYKKIRFYQLVEKFVWGLKPLPKSEES